MGQPYPYYGSSSSMADWKERQAKLLLLSQPRLSEQCKGCGAWGSGQCEYCGIKVTPRPQAT